MTSKKAYKKIDNLCCLNATRYQKDFFKDYEESKDPDFCKDTYEMVDCLETIKQSLDRLEKLGNVINLIKNKGRSYTYTVLAKDYEEYLFITRTDLYVPKQQYYTQQEFELLKEVFESDK